MKTKTKVIVAGCLSAALLTSGSVFAKQAAETITAVYRNIKLVVDGVLIEPKDANGEAVEPFIYNGTTYLPVRAVGEAFGKPVAWDGDNSTVYLGGEVEKPAKELELWNRSYIENSDTNRVFTRQKSDGDTLLYANLNDPEYANVKVNGRYKMTQSITYPLNSLAKTVKGQLYVTGDAASEGKLKILDSNGKMIYESPIMKNVTTPVNFDVNVEDDITVTFVFEHIGNSWDDMTVHIKNPVIVSSDY